MKKFNKSILIGISILFLTTNLYGIDWDFENPNGKPFLLTFTKSSGENYGVTLPISKWVTIKWNRNQFDDYYKYNTYELVENDIGHFYIPENISYESSLGGYYYMETGTYGSNDFNVDGYDLYSYQLNQSENEGYKNRIIDNIQLEIHIPLYKLWRKIDY